MRSENFSIPQVPSALRTVARYAFTYGFLLLAAQSASAQIANYPPSGPKTPAWSSLPDWNGVWERDGHIGWDPRIPIDVPQAPPYNAEYQAKFDDVKKAARAFRPVADNGARCLPGAMPGMMTMVFPMDIVMNPREVLITGEGSAIRHIYTDGRTHPADPFPSLAGHSVGHWEGKILVVDTCCVKESGTLPGSGPHSDAIRIKERIWAPDDKTLKDDIVVEDPKAFTKPWSTEKTYRRRPDWEPVEYVCEENNRNPVGEDGVTSVILPGN